MRKINKRVKSYALHFKIFLIKKKNNENNISCEYQFIEIKNMIFIKKKKIIHLEKRICNEPVSKFKHFEY